MDNWSISKRTIFPFKQPQAHPCMADTSGLRRGQVGLLMNRFLVIILPYGLFYEAQQHIIKIGRVERIV